MILIFILIGAILLGTGLQILVDKMVDYKMKMEIYKTQYWRQIAEVGILQQKLNAAQEDMRSMLDCCDVCLHNTNPDCPVECGECEAEACVCRVCRDNKYFTWRGIQETERRSGNDTGGETQDGGGDRKEPPETVFTAQAGS